MAQLDTTQLVALRTDITVTHKDEDFEGRTLESWWSTGNDQEISEWYALMAVPDVVVWREDLHRDEVNESVLYSELLTLNIVDLTVFDLMLMSNGGSVNAASQNIRDGFADVLSGPLRATSRNNLLAIAQRPATWGEALYATPVSGANVSAIYGDAVTRLNVHAARTA